MKCEFCGKEVDPEHAVSFWVGDESFQREHLAFFCDDECVNKWWSTPQDNPCTS